MTPFGHKYSVFSAAVHSLISFVLSSSDKEFRYSSFKLCFFAISINNTNSTINIFYLANIYLFSEKNKSIVIFIVNAIDKIFISK